MRNTDTQGSDLKSKAMKQSISTCCMCPCVGSFRFLCQGAECPGAQVLDDRVYIFESSKIWGLAPIPRRDQTHTVELRCSLALGYKPKAQA